MMEGNSRVSKFNVILIVIAIVSAIMAVIMINMPKLKSKIETTLKSSETIENSYTGETTNQVDISKNGDGSVIATLSDDGTLTISGSGEMKDFSSSESIKDILNSTEIIKVIIENGISNIGKYTFYECSTLTSIEIPSSVTSIGISAFHECASLKSINIPEGVTTIGNRVFYNCSNLTSINIPEEVTSIGDYAFSKCSNLTSINIPMSVISIGENAFEYCKALTSIDIPESVTTIQNYAFRSCENLIYLNIPQRMEKIGEYIFSGNQIINITDEEVTDLPDLLRRVQTESDILYSNLDLKLTNCIIEDEKIILSDKNKLAKINIVDGPLEGLGYIITYNKMDISENGDGSIIASINIDGLVTITGNGNIKDYGTTLAPWDDFRNHIKKVDMSEGITKIGEKTFWYCNNLESINIPEGLTSIENYAFYHCSSLTNINIPEGVTNIGEDAFGWCSSLTTINISSSVTNIGSGAFYVCNSLKEINVDENNIKYMDDNGVLYTKDKQTLIKYPPQRPNIEYEILEGVVRIEKEAFHQCKKLIKVIIPTGVEYIGYDTFSGCSSLNSINIPEGVTHIESSTFAFCTSLVSINIPEGVTNIRQFAFEDCISLLRIEIPSSVKVIEDKVFSGCTSLTEIKVDENNTKFSDVDGVVYTKDKTKLIKYPQGKEETKYKILKEAIAIQNNAFEYCTNLKSIEIPSSVTSIGEYAFLNCLNLETITIPEQVISIGQGSFAGCEKIVIICCSGSTAETYGMDKSINYKIDAQGPTISFSTNGTMKPVKETSTTITVEDELAGVVEESIKHIWSTQSENVTKEQIVNNLENGETLNINNVTGTYYLWIYAKDYLDNENIVRSEAFIMDNTPPTVETNYSTIVKTNQNVIVKIKANEEVQAVENWVLSEDEKTLTKEYSENKTETITIKDIAGNEIQQTIKISNIDKIEPTAQVSYSTTALTNQNVTVTIILNEEVQAVNGWILSQDKKILTKEYIENVTEPITIKDIAGNEIQQTITISNIDKTAPIVTAEYLLESEEYMKVTIIADEEIQLLDGWTLSEDKKVLTKGYSQNKTETVVIKDRAGNRTNIEIKVTGVKEIFKEKTYEIKDSYITKIKPNTTYENFIKNINTTKEYNITEKNQEVTGTMLIKTGQKLTTNNKTYILVVTGDINEDGKTNIVDLSRLKLAIVGKVNLEGEYKEASDVNSNGQVLQLTDLSKMKLYIVGKTSI